MLNLNNTLLAGGSYSGNQSWNKAASSLDQCFKLYQVTHGETLLFSNRNQYLLEAGKTYFINGYKIQKQNCPKSFKINWLHFLYGSILLKQFFLKFPVVTTLETAPIKCFENTFLLFHDYFKNIHQKNKPKSSIQFSNHLKINALIASITGSLIDNSEQDFFYFFGESHRLYPAIEFINTNFRKKISLKQLANLCFMSQNYFHSQFKKTLEITPNNYILQLRMNEALQLLTNSALSIGEIAVESGYSDAAFFSRSFTKYFSLSPKQYQKLLIGSVP